jgi:FKBP-type peptidyl-prolyl cis-trans isomerase FkpA
MLTAIFLLAQVGASPPAAAPDPAPERQAAVTTTTASGLRFQVLRAGTGRRPEPGDAVLVTYEGRLADGTMFDVAAQPVGLSVSELIPGFTEALLLMNEGGRYRFWIPAGLAYGAEGSGGVIPPDAALDFTVTLIRVGRPARP